MHIKATNLCHVHTVQLNLNFTHTHAGIYMHVLAHLMHAKLQKLACARTVACDFDVCTQESKHTRRTRDTSHKLTLGLPHYMCCVTTGTVAVGNEINRFAVDWLLYMLYISIT